MHLIDWAIVGLSVLSAVGISLYFSKKAKSSKDDYLLAGRSLGWFIAGTSIVATTFSSDTPLFVAADTRRAGIQENWWWWSSAIGQLAAVFFFARLWRRSEVTTDVEFIARRYDEGLPARALRIFRAVIDGVGINCIIVAAVTLGMVKVLTTILGLSNEPVFTIGAMGVNWTVIILVVLSVMTLGYAAISGLYGVVYTDVVQFMFAMVGCIALAIIVYVDASGGDGMLAKLATAPQFKESLLDFLPRFDSLNLALVTFVFNIGMIWWFQVPGGGFYVQRILATKNENEAAKAFLWYNFCHYVLRPWPWIIVGVLSLIYFPDLTGADAERAYPAMIAKFLPVGLLGIMVAALIAAHQSTVSTHLHLGVSYLVNDIYAPHIAPGKSQRHYVRASQLGMTGLMLVAATLVTTLSGITAVYKFLFVYWVGMGTVLIARWYWWRVNAWSEITALVTTTLMTWLLHTSGAETLMTNIYTSLNLIPAGEKDVNFFALRIFSVTAVVATLWVLVTFLTSTKTPSPKTIEFYRKIRVSGPGWATVARAAGIQPEKGVMSSAFVAWMISLVWIYSLLLGIGKLVLQEWWAGGILLAVGIATSFLLRNMLLRQNVLGNGPEKDS